MSDLKMEMPPPGATRPPPLKRDEVILKGPVPWEVFIMAIRKYRRVSVV